jgi:DNA-binding transcriptional LysR family regulator
MEPDTFQLSLCYTGATNAVCRWPYAKRALVKNNKGALGVDRIDAARLTMDTNILEDFLRLAETHNFSRAAADRHITQPAFSRRIQVLEDYVGAELIDRSQSPIQLTAAGLSFEASARELLEQLQAAKDNARAFDSSDKFHVNLAFSNSVITSYLPTIFSTLVNRVESFRVSAYTDNTEHCVDSLVSGESHFLSAMYSDDVPLPEKLTQFPYAVLSHTCLMPVSQPLPDGGPRYALDPRADSPLPFFTYSKGSYLLQVVDAFLEKKLDESLLNVVLQCNYSDGLIGLVTAGHGIAWLPKYAIRNELKNGTLVAAADPDWNIPMEYRMYGKGPFSPLVDDIIEDLKTSIEREE